MGFQKRRGELVLAIVVVMIILGLEGKCCGGALIVKSNTTYECKGNGRLDECRIAEDLELELDNLDFLMNPKVIRILQGTGSDSVTGGTNNPNRQSQSDCPPGKQYSGCIAPGDKQSDCKSEYNRSCQ